MTVWAIFRQELLRSSRQVWGYWVRVLYVALLGTIIAFSWLWAVGTEDAWRLQNILGEELFRRFVWAQFALTNLVAVFNLAAAIPAERRHRTLGILLSSPLSGSAIAMGKLLGGLLPVFLLILCGVPIVSLLLLFGSLSQGDLLAAYLLTVIAVVLSGALALLLSILTGGQLAAILVSAVLVLGALFGPPALIASLEASPPGEALYEVGKIQEITADAGVPRTEYTAYVLPYSAFFWSVSKGVSLPGVAIAVVSGLMLVCLVTAVSGRLLRSRRWYERQRLGRLRGLGGILLRRLGGERIKVATGDRWRGSAVLAGDLLGPRERFRRFLAQATATAACALGLFILIAGWHVLGPGAAVASLRLSPILVALLLGGVLFWGVQGFAGESEGRTLPLLLAAPLEAGQILYGKLRAVLMRMMLYGVVPVAYCLVFLACGLLDLVDAAALLLMLSAYGFFLAVVGLFAGLVAPNARWGMILAAALVLLFDTAVGGLPLLLTKVDPTIFPRAFMPYWIVQAWTVIGTERYGFLYLLGNLILHVLAGVGLLILLRRGFDRLAGRVACESM